MQNINSTLLSSLYYQADKSTLQQHLAAAVIQNNKQLSDSVCNADRNLCRRHHVPSLHAEARALLSFYGKNIYYNNCKRKWCFYDIKYKAKKVDVVVIRVTRGGELANARPCRKCLAMMEDLGVKRVHYSSGDSSDGEDEIITEVVKDMYSIQDSSSAKHFARVKYNYPSNDSDYYKYILKKSAPSIIKYGSLNHFIRFNLSYLLPSCSYSFCIKKSKTYVRIEDKKGFLIFIRIL